MARNRARPKGGESLNTRMTMTVTESPKKNERTCIGCGDKVAPDELVRLVLSPDGATVAVDAAGGSFGRGAHVHGNAACVARAAKGGLARSFKREIRITPAELSKDIADALSRRVAGLITSARSAGHLAIGADASIEALNKGAPLALVAIDAAAAAQLGAVERAVAEGRAVAFGRKSELGRLLGKEDVAVLAITHKGIAGHVASLVRTASAVTVELGGSEDR
jgi:predicted RNA-binding protein YlxR (DUF448 family)